MLIDVVRDGLRMVVRNYVMIDASINISIEYGVVRHTDIFLNRN